MESSHTLVAPPELALGRYRLIGQLGSGGFGVVWHAYDEQLHRDVALKRVWLGPEGDGERAAREAKAAARLAHPAIVALHDTCEHDGAFYLISELVHGHTLAQLLAEDLLEDEEILEIGVALADALIHAHARGVIHRDIKPQNVLVPEPTESSTGPTRAHLAAAKLTDFGGASLIGEEALTRTGDVLGTLAYMSPEQSEGREAGTQSDLYSLALVLYQAFSGANPVRGATPAATARRIGQPLPPLARARRDLPPTLTHALDVALSPAPQRRGTLEELRQELERALERGLRARRPRRAVRGAARPVALADGHTALAEPARAAARVHEDGAPAPAERHGGGPRLVLPRTIWLPGALVVIAWQTLAGRPGVGLLTAAALALVLLFSSVLFVWRTGVGWLACALAPALGYLGLAGAFPAIAGQATRWRERAALGALGYWWLRLAEPLLGRKLWLGPPVHTPAHAAWEGSVALTATHILGPLLTLAVLSGALLWAAAGAMLPWLVRGHSAARDLIAVAAWTGALVLATPAVESAFSAHAAHPMPHGALLGALLGALVGVVARALRGPV